MRVRLLVLVLCLVPGSVHARRASSKRVPLSRVTRGLFSPKADGTLEAIAHDLRRAGLPIDDTARMRQLDPEHIRRTVRDPLLQHLALRVAGVGISRAMRR